MFGKFPNPHVRVDLATLVRDDQPGNGVTKKNVEIAYLINGLLIMLRDPDQPKALSRSLRAISTRLENETSREDFRGVCREFYEALKAEYEGTGDERKRRRTAER